ncbi:type I phosphomannose isomerase catalytic subunit [Candidatus Methylacidiphilum infernorum]|uniref:Phosphomannose isomerase n=1 Tax=Methylacidiphilum infernorum (isolate V4) TaxID=481448 RepID=B3DXG3_METI4|nr:type I phosphomannose isomerase catalytic subunit [Candidatus Methylacidiphilum infernorum]ACD83872.1 Phosphomannose isomerase [Methylacidiphilum infernorum V4]
MAIFQFKPIYKKKIWGGGRLKFFSAKHNHQQLTEVGEVWELVDRKEERSELEVPCGSMNNLHELWLNKREEIFGKKSPAGSHFPLIIKILDCRLPTSIQVHPDENTAKIHGWEKKTEFWFFLDTAPGSFVYLGFKERLFPGQLASVIGKKEIIKYINAIPTSRSHGLLVHSGQVHAIGGGNLILEIQENSDTTFRIYDWERKGGDGHPRPIHDREAMHSLSLFPYTPRLLPPEEISIIEKSFALKRIELGPGQSLLHLIDEDSFMYFFFCEGKLLVEKKLYEKGQALLVSADHGPLKITGIDKKNEIVAVYFP